MLEPELRRCRQKWCLTQAWQGGCRAVARVSKWAWLSSGSNKTKAGSSHFILWESSGWIDGTREYEKGKNKELYYQHLLSQEPSLELPHLFPWDPYIATWDPYIVPFLGTFWNVAMRKLSQMLCRESTKLSAEEHSLKATRATPSQPRTKAALPWVTRGSSDIWPQLRGSPDPEAKTLLLDGLLSPSLGGVLHCILMPLPISLKRR